MRPHEVHFKLHEAELPVKNKVHATRDSRILCSAHCLACSLPALLGNAVRHTKKVGAARDMNEAFPRWGHMLQQMSVLPFLGTGQDVRDIDERIAQNSAWCCRS